MDRVSKLLTVIVIVWGIFTLALLYNEVGAHDEWCDGVRVVDVRDGWVKIRELAHFGSTDLHMETSARWISIEKLKAIGCDV